MEERVLPKESFEVKRILDIINALFLEIRLDGNYVRLPMEMRPIKKELSMKEADDAITTSLEGIRKQIRPLVVQLSELDPNYFDIRLMNLLEEWPKSHQGENLVFFGVLKFYIEAHVDMILFKTNR